MFQVHRRFKDPMFSISNKISYDELMIQEKPLNWIFYTGKATETVKLQEKVSAMIPFKKTSAGNLLGCGLGNVVGNTNIFYNSYWKKCITEDPSNWEKADSNSAHHKIGAGNYEISYGSDFFLEAHDLTGGTVTRVPADGTNVK